MIEKRAQDVHLVVFACEAGMGSSLIGANQLKKRIKNAGLDVKVIHSPVNQIPANTDVVVAHEGLAARARAGCPAGGRPDLPELPQQLRERPADTRLEAGEPSRMRRART